MKHRDSPRRGRKTTFALIVLGLLCLSFIISLSYRLTTVVGKKKEPSEIRVQVLNGAGVNRLAQLVTDILREKGFDVVDFANAKMEDLEETVVIDRESQEEVNARIVAGAIGCRNVTCEIDPLLLQEVTIILGRDYQKFFGKYLSDKEF